MPISIIDNFDVNAPKNIDGRLGPYDTTASAILAIDETTQRYLGLTVVVTGSGTLEEYWFQNGVTDSDLVLKSSGISPSQTGSFLTTASAEFSEVTFTKGDASTFLVDTTPRQVIETVKNLETGTLLKGTPVYASGSTGNAIHVYAASASLSSRMPAAYVLGEDLTSGQEGIGILTGFINGVDTSAFASGDVVYVGAEGGYTNVKPTGSNLIQNLGKVTISAVNGSGVISGAGRANDVPNLLKSQIFFGSGSNQAQQIHISGALDATVINNITASGDISSSATVYGLTGSFGTSTTTITDNVVTTGYVSASGTLYGGGLLIDGNSVLSGSVTVHASNTNSQNINFENDGTNSPLSRIRGQSYAGGNSGGLDFLYHNGTSLTEGFRLRDGRIGIGTIDPSQALEVTGNISASGYISASNGFIGDGSNITGVVSSSYAVTASHALNAPGGNTQVDTYMYSWQAGTDSTFWNDGNISITYDETNDDIDLVFLTEPSGNGDLVCCTRVFTDGVTPSVDWIDITTQGATYQLAGLIPASSQVELYIYHVDHPIDTSYPRYKVTVAQDSDSGLYNNNAIVKVYTIK